MRHVRLLLVFCVAFLVTFFAACGSTSRHTGPVATPTLTRLCPPGQSAMGCASRQPKLKPTLRRGGAPAGALFPDVYEGQGAVNWGAVKSWQLSHGWKAAAIFKLGEYRIDGQASRNASETARLGFWRAGYWFVRNTGCASEAQQIVASGRAFRLRVLVLDTEVPEAAGYTGCLAPAVRRAGFVVVVYTAPGTWPGGTNFGLPLWLATYGSHFGCIWTCSPVAWQFTDGQFGSPVNVPGVGFDDVSVDFGITRLGVPPPDPYAEFATGPFPSKWGKLNERTVVKQYDAARQHTTRLPKLEAELRFLAGRDSFVAHHPLQHGKPTWGLYHRGWRYQQLIHRAQGRKFV